MILGYLKQGEKGQSIGGHGKERSPTKGSKQSIVLEAQGIYIINTCMFYFVYLFIYLYAYYAHTHTYIYI